MTDLDAVYSTNITSLPLAAMFQQATRSNGLTFALLFIYFIDILFTVPGAWITAGRMLWTLGRDDATPCTNFIRKVSPRFKNPFNAQILCAIGGTILGAIYVGSATAFNAFVGRITDPTSQGEILGFVRSRRTEIHTLYYACGGRG